MGGQSGENAMKNRGKGRPGRYSILLFDIDNTLLDFDASEAEAFKALLAKSGMEPEDRLVEEYHQINRRCWELFEEGRIEKEEVLIRRFELFFSGHGVRTDGREEEEIYRSFLRDSAILIPGALGLCRELSREHRLYAVTNGVADTQYRRLSKSGLSPFFTDIFVSEEAGSQKPQKEFFDYCFQRIRNAFPEGGGPSREEMLLIGDSLTSDMRGGENAGIDTCWYNPGGAGNDAGIPVTAEISSYEELKRFLASKED